MAGFQRNIATHEPDFEAFLEKSLGPIHMEVNCRPEDYLNWKVAIEISARAKRPGTIRKYKVHHFEPRTIELEEPMSGAPGQSDVKAFKTKLKPFMIQANNRLREVADDIRKATQREVHVNHNDWSDA